jgi:hypothetical protein
LALESGRPIAHIAQDLGESLAVMLRRHRADDSVSKAIGRLIRADLITRTCSSPTAATPTDSPKRPPARE